MSAELVAPHDRKDEPPRYSALADGAAGVRPASAAADAGLTASRYRSLAAILGRSPGQMAIAVVIFVWMTYNNYCLFSESAKESLKLMGGSNNDKKWTEKELLLCYKILKSFFGNAIISTILVSRGLRDYLFGELVGRHQPQSAHARSFRRNVVYLAAGLYMLVMAVYDAIDLEGALPWSNVMAFLMVQSLATLNLATLVRDGDDRAEIDAMAGGDGVKLECAHATLKRSALQLMLTLGLLVWMSVLNYNLFSGQQRFDLAAMPAKALVLANNLLVALFVMSMASTALMAGGLRDHQYGETVDEHFSGAGGGGGAHSGGLKNLRYFFIGLAVMALALLLHRRVEEDLPWKNVLMFLSVESLALLNFITPLRDRWDADSVMAERARPKAD